MKNRWNNFILFSLTPFGRFVLLLTWTIIIVAGFLIQFFSRGR